MRDSGRDGWSVSDYGRGRVIKCYGGLKGVDQVSVRKSKKDGVRVSEGI